MQGPAAPAPAGNGSNTSAWASPTPTQSETLGCLSSLPGDCKLTRTAVEDLGVGGGRREESEAGKEEDKISGRPKILKRHSSHSSCLGTLPIQLGFSHNFSLPPVRLGEVILPGHPHTR